MVYHLYTNHPFGRTVLELFPSMEQSQIQVIVLLLGWGGSFQGIASFKRITDPCTELGLRGAQKVRPKKLENSSFLERGTGTNDLLTLDMNPLRRLMRDYSSTHIGRMLNYYSCT